MGCGACGAGSFNRCGWWPANRGGNAWGVEPVELGHLTFVGHDVVLFNFTPLYALVFPCIYYVNICMSCIISLVLCL